MILNNEATFFFGEKARNAIKKFFYSRLSDVKNLVNQLYEALNVQEHHVTKERELSTEIETLKQELLPMENVSEIVLIFHT